MSGKMMLTNNACVLFIIFYYWSSRCTVVLGWSISTLSNFRSFRQGYRTNPNVQVQCRSCTRQYSSLSDYFESDLLAIRRFPEEEEPRLCVLKLDGFLQPVCLREDNLETDLFLDPREGSFSDLDGKEVTKYYGVGYYGQRPVPSLGGGPGYGADADEIWSIDEHILEQIRKDNVALPILDVGIAHGEKARGGAF